MFLITLYVGQTNSDASEISASIWLKIFSFGPMLSYTPDVFGRDRRFVEQQRALAESQLHQLAGAYVTLTASDERILLRTDPGGESLVLPHLRKYGVFDDEAGCALRGTFLLDRSGTVTWRVVNGIGEPRDVLEHLRVALQAS